MLVGVQSSILKMVAQGEDLKVTLSRLCAEVERLLPGTRASILSLDTEKLLHPCAAPSLPDDYSNAADGVAIGPLVGSCGSAAYLQEPVVVSDIETDPRWTFARELALPLGLKACFSSPIFGSSGTVLGTFALYFLEPRAPSPFEQSIVEGCLPLCMIAFERHERLVEDRRLAFTDILTGLPNRAKFNEMLERQIEAEEWTLALIDLDNLKTVNDTFGHAAGDELIITAASRLSDALAPVGAYRLGGDEFAVILDSAGTRIAEDIASNLIAAASRPADCDGHSVFTTASIGLAKSNGSLSVHEMRHNADLALYHAKDTRRGEFVTYDDSIATGIAQRSAAILSVASALREDRMEAWYQPIVRLDTEKIVGVEALARMRSPDGKIIPAAEFHEATKDAHVAAALTRQMVACVARDVGGWLRSGIPLQHVGINLSAADFACSDLPESLTAAFGQENVPLHHAILEITESVYLGADSDEAAPLFRDDCAPGFRDDLAPCFSGVCRQ